MKRVACFNVVLLLLVFLILFSVMDTFLRMISTIKADQVSQVVPPEMDGPFTVGWIDVDIPTAGLGTLGISVYYPSISYGEGSTPNGTEAPYPTLLFSPGFQTTLDFYRGVASRIASWGFIFALVGSARQAWDVERASDVNHTLNWLVEQNRNASFLLTNLMDEYRLGVSGHSLGGEAAVLVSRSDARYKVVFPMAPFINSMTEASPESAAEIHVPILILVGSADTTAPPSTMSYPFYDHGNAPKLCITLEEINHLGIAYSSFKYIVSFLEFYLYGDQDYARYLYGIDAQQEVQTGIISLKYDLRETVNYQALFEGVAYNVSVYSDSAFLTFSFNETLNEMNFTLQGPPFTSGTANITVPKQLVRDYDFRVYFDENSYSFTASNDTFSYFVYLAYDHSEHQLIVQLVDLTPPMLVVTSPAANSVFDSPNVTIVWSGEDSASGLDYFETKIDNGTWINTENTDSYTFAGLTDGDHVAYIEAFDKAGNKNTVSVNFKIDTTVHALWMQSWFWASICLAAISIAVIIYLIGSKKSGDRAQNASTGQSNVRNLIERSSITPY